MNSLRLPTWTLWVALVVVSGLFVLMRSFNLPESLFFINDIGRDYLVLSEWQASWKPPLLGPQTSALPLNQSPFYFYLLFPAFVVMGGSPYATFMTCLLLSLGLFWWGVWQWWRDERYRPLLPTLAVFGFLVALHPQLIIQNRFIWNPSFVLPFTAVSVAAWLMTITKPHWRTAATSGAAVAAAVGMNVSAAPALLATWVIALYQQRWKAWQVLTGSAVALLILFLPVLAFELKYDFQIIKRTLAHGQGAQSVDTRGPWGKFVYLNELVGMVPLNNSWVALYGAVWLTIAISVYLDWRDQESSLRARFNRLSLSFLAVSTLLIMVAPFRLDTHYIFGILTGWLWVIATLRPRWALLAGALLATVWLRPAQLNQYFQRAPRTIADVERCAQEICRQETEPVFVSLQAGYLPFHNGPEFQYFLQQAGCNVKTIAKGADQASRMVVFVDQSSYVHGETTYHELSLFGPSQEQTRYQCQSGLSAHVLRKNLK